MTLMFSLFLFRKKIYYIIDLFFQKIYKNVYTKITNFRFLLCWCVSHSITIRMKQSKNSDLAGCDISNWKRTSQKASLKIMRQKSQPEINSYYEKTTLLALYNNASFLSNFSFETRRKKKRNMKKSSSFLHQCSYFHKTVPHFFVL